MQIGMKKSILADTKEECKSLKLNLEDQRLHSGGFSAAAKQDLKVCSPSGGRGCLIRPEW